ncbi:membrane protein [Lysobacter arseniciresistens ZS79]|uniref:Membrane protein n=1 Tax=Lysobacter arseniciresistens ZS79 TaxID=913325 RepID=A0A0A0F8R4_9GAMM|nr:membrane protein [Lysobacter arseniciresistens ZS79]
MPMRTRTLASLLLSTALAAAATPALAAGDQASVPGARTLSPPVVSLRVDNDLLASQDQGYTNGLQLTLVSPNLVDFTDDPNLPWLARWLNTRVGARHPEGVDQLNMVVRLSQNIYTPTDPFRTDLMVEDRPYAGLLMGIAGYNLRRDDTLDTVLVGAGVVGPASMAEDVQGWVHDLTGSEEFRGWDHQLPNEPVLGIRYERTHRDGKWSVGDGGLQVDAISHWGGALGSPMTRLNAGYEVRLGHRLPDDFGSSPVRPAGDNTAPPANGRLPAGWAWHAFAAVDGYWSIYDVSLDGTLFRDSHSVDKRAMVADLAVGAAVTVGGWKFALARYFRTREFEGQRERPSFGSFTVSRSL